MLGYCSVVVFQCFSCEILPSLFDTMVVAMFDMFVFGMEQRLMWLSIVVLAIRWPVHFRPNLATSPRHSS